MLPPTTLSLITDPIKVTGTALYPDWFSAWHVPLIQRNTAITVLPNYRLTPEHTGNDILEDLADFWKWINGGGLTDFFASQKLAIEVDFEHMLVSGDSAGGYMALMSGISMPRGAIKAIIAQYPMTNYLRCDPDAPFKVDPKPPLSLVDEHIASITPGTVISSATPPARMELSFALAAYGRYNEFFGTGKHLWPITAIEEAEHFPPTLIIHGEQDTAVSIEDSRAFVKKAGEVVPGAEIKFAMTDGDHGFDVEMKEDEHEWLREGLEWVESKWLA